MLKLTLLFEELYIIYIIADMIINYNIFPNKAILIFINYLFFKGLKIQKKSNIDLSEKIEKPMNKDY
jgi:hypothetical protein